MQMHIKSKYSVSDPKGIEDLKAIKIGGVDQWVHIRGRNRDNPLLLVIHGGPGDAFIGCLDSLQRPWEDFFTVVNWDQRRSGKSFCPIEGINDSITIGQYISDSVEMVQYLCEYLGKEKLFILGISFGTVLGMHVLKQRPERIHAYVGLGQVVNMLVAEELLCRRLIDRANENCEYPLASRVERILEGLGSNSPQREKTFFDNCEFVRRELTRLSGEATVHSVSYGDFEKCLTFEKMISPHLTIEDVRHVTLDNGRDIFQLPYDFSREVCDVNLPSDVGSVFDAPVFFFTGCHDWQTPRSLSDQWYEIISAPYKELVHFSKSAHAVFFEEPGKVLVALVNKVLPFARGA